MLLDILKAFLVGGAVCAVGQFLIDFTKLTPARILTGFVITGVILSALGLYEPFADFAGAGATVPLTGFGHLLAEGIRKTIENDGLLGIFTGGLTAAAGGVTAALLFGLIASFLFRQKDRS
ncbi:stage V sporulation protein AE [Ruminococcus flavefaciens]|uniref:Stage V sporulation protein AE n=1 Tax=Ruminococcus flavefaciens TaxID=1265 RepID=A0A1H6IP39_RUMFL|nr:stage V sporulation protein AE [Ruminococcus flavefaciens]